MIKAELYFVAHNIYFWKTPTGAELILLKHLIDFISFNEDLKVPIFSQSPNTLWAGTGALSTSM